MSFGALAGGIFDGLPHLRGLFIDGLPCAFFRRRVYTGHLVVIHAVTLVVHVKDALVTFDDDKICFGDIVTTVILLCSL